MEENLLKYSELKVDRAEKLISELDSMLVIWNNKKDISFKIEMFDNNLGYEIIVSECTSQDFLDQLGLLIGDILHNLRSSLDNLAYALACLKKNPPEKSNEIYFPITKDEIFFNKKVKPNLKKNMSEEIIEIIEKFQPFQRLKPEIEGEPKTDALAVLQWLNNADKHRIPNVLLLVPIKYEQNIKVQYNTEEEAKLDDPPQIEVFGYPIKKGSVIFRQLTKTPIKKIELNLNLTVNVSLQGPNSAELIPNIVQNLHFYVATVIELFRPFFENKNKG